MDNKRNPHFIVNPYAITLKKTYLVGKVIGNGSYGTVYKARDNKENRHVALKISRTDDRLEANTELRYLIAVKGVPEFVQISDYFEFDFGYQRHHKVIVMEALETDLGSLFDRPTEFLWHVDNIKKILVQVAKGLAFIHKEGIIHGDIKPDNILLAEEPCKRGTPPRDLSDYQPHLSVKISDLGLARKAPASGPIQTRSFRAPEVFRRKKYGTSADIWSLGCMAYYFFAGTTLFRVNKDLRKEEQDRLHLNQIEHICGYVYGRKARKSGRSKKKIDHTYKKIYSLQMKMGWKRAESVIFADWISDTFKTNPKKRATAEDCLSHPLLRLNNVQNNTDDMNAIFAARKNIIEEEDSDGDGEEEWDEEIDPDIVEIERRMASPVPFVPRKQRERSRDSDIEVVFERKTEKRENGQRPVKEEIISQSGIEDAVIPGSVKGSDSDMKEYRLAKSDEMRHASGETALELQFTQSTDDDFSVVSPGFSLESPEEEHEKDSTLGSVNSSELNAMEGEEAQVVDVGTPPQENVQANPRKRAMEQDQKVIEPKMCRFSDIRSE